MRIFLTAFFFAIVYGIPLTQAVLHMPPLLTALPTRPNLRAYEQSLDDASVVAKLARPWIQSAWLRLFHYAGEKVVDGRDGFLFYRPDVDYLVHTRVARPLPAILDFRDQLATRGIRLMVLPVPGKPSIYPDKLSATAHRDTHSPTESLIAQLRAAGIETPDLFAQFRSWRASHPEPLYLAQDTHWSGTGAQLAGSIIARRLLDLGWVQPGPTRFDETCRPIARHGDLTRMLAVPWVESTPCCQVPAAATSGPASPVLVLGDSFLRIYQTDEPRNAGFLAHLARGLGQPVASIVNDGGASTLVRQELARRSALLQGKKVVLWEFVERDLEYGAEGWKKVRLP